MRCKVLCDVYYLCMTRCSSSVVKTPHMYHLRNIVNRYKQSYTGAHDGTLPTTVLILFCSDNKIIDIADHVHSRLKYCPLEP